MTRIAGRLTGRRWITLLTSFAVLAFVFSFGIYSLPAIYRPLTVAFGWKFAGANAGGSIVLFLSGVLSPFVGALVDTFKPKRVILGGTVIMAVALALLSSVHSLGEYYAYCFLLGVGASAVSILPASILVAPLFPRRRGLAIGFLNAGIGLGGFIAPRITTAEIASRGLSGTFLVLAGCMAIPFVLTLIVIENEESGIDPLASNAAASAPEVIRMPLFWIFGFAVFFSAHAVMGVQQNLMSYLMGGHVSPKEAALISGIAIGAAALGKMAAGILADWASARTAMIGSLACVALGVLGVLNTAPQSGMLYWLAIVFGVGYGGIFNAVPTIVFEFFGTHQVGKTQGLFRVFLGLGTATGGVMAGYLFDATQRWSVSFSVDFALVCVSLLLLLVSARQTRASMAPADRAQVVS